MKSRNATRVALDVALAATLVAVMATALVQEAPHEWLGVALFGLTAAHMVVNRAWLATMFRGRRRALRVLQVIVIVGLVACVVGLIASSLVISKHAFGFLPALPGAGWARSVHMLCSHWMFVLAFAHVGLHVRDMRGLASWQAWALRVVFASVACFGAYSFVRLNLWAYLTGQVQFAFVDPGIPLAISLARYASVAVLLAGVFHYVRAGIVFAARRRRRRS